MAVTVACDRGELTVSRPDPRTAYLVCRLSPNSSPSLSVTPSPSGSGTPAPTSTVSPSGHAGERVIDTAYTTAYTYYDNTPPGSAAISHPVLHRTAGGAGTYADPTTIAVGHSIINGRDILNYPAGTRMYIPHVRRYFIVEDTCGDGDRPQDGPCHDLSSAPAGATTWVDMWIGGVGSNRLSVQACASRVTDGDRQLHRIIVNPASTYPVVPGPVFNGACSPLYS